MEQNKENKNLSFLDRLAVSQKLVFFGLFILLIPFMMHTATLLLSVSVIKSQLYAYFFALGFDVAIFIFAAHGRKNSAGGVAVVVFLLNFAVLNFETLNTMFDPLVVKLIITALLSGSGAWILHSYVMMFNEKKVERSNIDELESENFKKQGIIIELKKKLSDLEKVNQDYLLVKKELEIVRQNYNDLQEKQMGATESLFNIMGLKESSTKDIEVNTKEKDIEVLEVPYTTTANGVVCKKCNQTFGSVDKLNAYKDRGLCNFVGCAEDLKKTALPQRAEV